MEGLTTWSIYYGSLALLVGMAAYVLTSGQLRNNHVWWAVLLKCLVLAFLVACIVMGFRLVFYGNARLIQSLGAYVMGE